MCVFVEGIIRGLGNLLREHQWNIDYSFFFFYLPLNVTRYSELTKINQYYVYQPRQCCECLLHEFERSEVGQRNGEKIVHSILGTYIYYY